MASADIARTAVGILGNIISLGLFLAPLPTFYSIWKRGSVEQFSPAPYLATLLNCMLWVVYGLPIVHPHSTLVVTINGAGCLIEITFIILFLIYSDGKQRIKVVAMLLVEVAVVAAVAILVITLVHTYERRSLIIGTMCIVFCIMMYVAPLSVMKLVIATKSVEYMPLSISLASLANGVCWTTYALIRFDLYITIPNGLGTLFGIAQLILYATFYKSTKRQLEARKAKGDAGLGMTEVVIGDTKKVCNGSQKGRAPEIHETK